MKQDILNLENKVVGSIELDKSIFGLEVCADILHRVVVWQLARLQAGTHKTKGRSEVALTPAKPFKQKGGGRARQGSRKAALSAKAKEGNLVIIDEAKLAEPKTKDLKNKLEALKLSNSLFIDGKEVDTNFALASRNLIGVDILPTIGANVYDILRKEKLVLTKDAVVCLGERLK